MPSLLETETLPAASTVSTRYWATPLEVMAPVPVQFRPSPEWRSRAVQMPFGLAASVYRTRTLSTGSPALEGVTWTLKFRPLPVLTAAEESIVAGV